MVPGLSPRPSSKPAPTAPTTGPTIACCCARAKPAESNGGVGVTDGDIDVVDEGVVVGVGEAVAVSETVELGDAEEPREMLAVGVTEGVDDSDEPGAGVPEGDGDGDGAT